MMRRSQVSHSDTRVLALVLMLAACASERLPEERALEVYGLAVRPAVAEARRVVTSSTAYSPELRRSVRHAALVLQPVASALVETATTARVLRAEVEAGEGSADVLEAVTRALVSQTRAVERYVRDLLAAMRDER